MDYNVLYNDLPTSWSGYKINTDFTIGVQLNLLFDDQDLTDDEKDAYIIYLLFGNEDGTIREFPQNEEDIVECITFLLNGWHHDRPAPGEKDNTKIIDYYIDQGRIYADFMHNYGIDLNKTHMHFWAFQWLLWNMPHDHSSLMQVMEIRTKKPRKKASAEEIKEIQKGHAIYDLGRRAKEYNDAQKQKIDAFDEMKRRIQENKQKGGVNSGGV